MIAAQRFLQPISAPGTHHLQRMTLSWWRRRAHRGVRRSDFELYLAPCVDCLLAVVLFLLSLFAQRHACLEAGTRLPSATHVEPLAEGPVVVVSDHDVRVDGVLVAVSTDVVANGRVTHLGALYDVLKNKRELWRTVHPDAVFPGRVMLYVDRQVPALLVKSLFQTAGKAGYPEVGLAVWHR